MNLSVIIPFYKNTDYLLRLLQNLSTHKSFLNNELIYEVIIVIDSPETDLVSLNVLLNQGLEPNFFKQIQFIKNEKNLGVAQSRNIGLANAQGDWLHIVDQDDVFCEDIYSLINNKGTATNLILVNGYFNYSKPTFRHKIYYLKPTITLENLIVDDFIRSPGQVLFSKSLANHIKFRTAPCHKGCDDRFFWIELFANNAIDFSYINKPFYVANIHSENFSLDSMQLYRCSIELWELIDLTKLKNYLSYINSNKATLDYIVSNKRNFYSIVSFLKYKFRPYRLIRYFYKYLNKFLHTV